MLFYQLTKQDIIRSKKDKIEFRLYVMHRDVW